MYYFSLLLFQIYVIAVTEDQFAEVTVGTRLTIPCQTDKESSTVVWHHYPVGLVVPKIVYLNGMIFEAYRNRVTVNVSRSGVFNLVILRVSLVDSGKYTCTIGTPIQSLELIVFELYPSPHTCASNSSGIDIIGRNTCRIEPDIVRLNCTLRYQGNFHAALEWKSISGKSKSTLEAIDNRTTVSTVILKAEQLQSTAFTCFVKYFNVTVVSNFSCTLAVNITTLPNETREYNPKCDMPTVPCSANTVNCSYTWTDDKSERIISDSNLALQNLQDGQYTCKADCLIRRKHCTFVPVKANITCGYEQPAVHNSGKIVGAVIGTLAVVASVIVLLFFSYRYLRCFWRRNPDQRHNRTPTEPDDEMRQSQPMMKEIKTEGRIGTTQVAVKYL